MYVVEITKRWYLRPCGAMNPVQTYSFAPSELTENVRRLQVFLLLLVASYREPCKYRTCKRDCFLSALSLWYLCEGTGYCVIFPNVVNCYDLFCDFANCYVHSDKKYLNFL
jgi:hypothetical protein